MASRASLQTLLQSLSSSVHVYYDPPESVKMSYPAIVYKREQIGNEYANNAVYAQFKTYQLIVIDKSVDNPIVDAVSKLPGCSFVRHYRADNLSHDIFNINY